MTEETPTINTDATTSKTPTDKTPTETSAADIQKALDETHTKASKHYKDYDAHSYDTADQMRQYGNTARKISENLHNIIETSTPKEAPKTVIRQDRDNATQATSKITPEDPLKAYEGYSAYAIPQNNTNDEKRNYYENPLKYDKFVVDGNNVKYNLTEVIPGGETHATNNPNYIIGTDISEQSFSYNEKTSRGKTTITVETTTKGTCTASSEHIHAGQNYTTDYENTATNTNVYDSNNYLIEHTHHNQSSYHITDSHTKAHKGQDMSGADKGYFQTGTEIHTNQQGTMFYYTKLNKNRAVDEKITGSKTPRRETYYKQTGNKYITTSYEKNDKGDWLHTGKKGQIEGDQITITEILPPKQAEKEFRRLQQDVDSKTKELTGKSFEEYNKQLGNKKPAHNLDTIFNNYSTPEDAAQARKANAEMAEQFATTPAALVAIKSKGNSH